MACARSAAESALEPGGRLRGAQPCVAGWPILDSVGAKPGEERPARRALAWLARSLGGGERPGGRLRGVPPCAAGWPILDSVGAKPRLAGAR